MGFDFKKWYDENGDRLNKARRARYETDEAYRKSVLQTNRASRRKRQGEDEGEKKAEKKAQKVEVSDAWRVVEVDGKEYLTIGALARVLGKSVKTLRLWESKGILEETPNRSPKGERLYSPDQVLEIRKKLEAEGKVSDVQSTPRLRPLIRDVRLKSGATVEMRLFRIGSLARTVGRSTATLLQLEAKGRFPETPLRSPGGQRLYTLEMMESARRAFTSFDRKISNDWEEFFSEVIKGWDGLGLNGAEVLPVVKPTK